MHDPNTPFSATEKRGLSYLCIGYVSEFLDEPELARKGWRQRLPLAELVHANGWGGEVSDDELCQALEESCPR